MKKAKKSAIFEQFDKYGLYLTENKMGKAAKRTKVR